MICPKCRAEYRQGYTSCADCHVLLVRELPAGRTWAEAREESAAGDDALPVEEQESGEDRRGATIGDPNVDPFCSFWKGTDLRVCTEICAVLDEAGIPHKTIRRQDHLFNLNNQAPYEVGVPASLYEKAEMTIGEAFGSERGQGENSLLLTEESSKSFPELVNLPAEEKWRGRPEEEIPGLLDFLTGKLPGQRSGEKTLVDEIAPRVAMNDAKRFPEDATVEVWSGADVGLREMIEMSLQENDLVRREEKEAGETKVFVFPEDEERARQIVREVVEGTPQGEEEG